MIIVPSNSRIEEYFQSALIDGSPVLFVDCSQPDLVKEISENLEDKAIPEDIYTFGLDFGKNAARVTLAIYELYGKIAKIYCIPTIEEPDRVEYIYKQKISPDIHYCYNAEPFISFEEETVKLYYNSVLSSNDFSKADALIEEFGDFWNVSNSEYEKARMRNVRELVVKHNIKKVLDIGSYLGQLDDLLEMNGLDVVRTDISPAVLKKDTRVRDLNTMTQEELEILMKDHAVLFASVLFAYHGGSPNSNTIEKVMLAIKKANPKYIIYEDSVLNLSSPAINNDWIELFGRMGYNQVEHTMLDEVVEQFYENKCIKRAGSFAVILQHFGGNS